MAKPSMIIIVLPTHNEAAIIRSNLERLIAYLRANINEPRRVIVADNGSTDTTRGIVRDIAAQEPCLELIEIPETGKGRAVLTAWQCAAEPSTINYQLSIFIFMDADLATDLAALPALIAAIRNGADVAIGSRHARGAQVERTWSRRLISRCYQFLLRALFGLRATDAPCGFKAVNARVVREIVPLIRDRQWFFDTELLIRAQVANLRIVEIPVEWREPRRKSSLRKILRIIGHDFRAMRRLRQEFRKTGK